MGKKDKKKQKDKPRYSLRQNLQYMFSLAWREQKSVLVLCLLAAVLAVVMNLMQLFIAPTVLGLVEANAPLRSLVTTILLFAAGFMVLSALERYIGMNQRPGQIHLRTVVLQMVHHKFLTTSYVNIENQDFQKKREKAQKATDGNWSSIGVLWENMSTLLQNMACFVIYLIMLTAVDPILIVVAMATTIFGYFVNRRIYAWGYNHRDEEAEHSRHMTYVNDQSRDLTIAKDIRVFGLRTWLNDMHTSAYRLYDAFVTRREKAYLGADVVLLVMTILRNGFAYAYLIGMVLRGELGATEFLLYFSVASSFTDRLTELMEGFTNLNRNSLEISAMREYLSYPEPFLFETGTPLVAEAEKAYTIELRDVSFRYFETDKNTLQNINLILKPGEKIAVVGMNGAGKTTLIKLICGFYDPTEGAVLLDGVDIRTYNRQDYYTFFAAVFQDFSVLATSVAQNIAQSVHNVSIETVQDCAHRAGLDQWLGRLPNGLDTNLGKDVHDGAVALSGGETQRLMLARALYKNAPILLLDEPTAALDPIAESDMYNRYNELTQGHTAVYISHRLASTRFCDRILLLEGNRIAEEGTHDELMAKGGRYAELFAIQSQYYREEGMDDVG